MEIKITLHPKAVAALLATRDSEDKRTDEEYCRAWAVQRLKGRLNRIVEQRDLDEVRKARGPAQDAVE